MRMAVFVVSLMVTVAIIATSVDGKEFLDHREIEVQRILKQLNKPALKSIKSEDGDIIDCVPITSQPAFDHPLLKNHTVQMRPSFIPEGGSTYTKKKTKATQVWQKNGECPEKTVPIRRITREEILRAKSIESFGKKNHQSIPDSNTNPGQNHEYAIMNLNNGNKYFGTSFIINLWKPEVQVPSEFSLAQTWLVSGFDNSRNTIEAGFQVYPGKYNDNNLRLFVYWTANGYQPGSGCYNNDCPGFIQMSNRIAVGVSYYNTVSQYDGDQYELFIQIWKDDKNWWLKINEELVGYWPGDLFNSFGDGAPLVQWGGEIVNFKTDMKHTTTDMGSGRFADEGFKKASYFRNLMIVDEANRMKDPEGLYPNTTNDTCYNIKAGGGGPSWGANFFYGGPGQNEKCP
ncbi:Protein neprosin [Cardamine amara subsp. amara]|uniref:Protein neprosin n=1 Tax=Cardamine amara subsp. amara TaxID=228776 RepID=A0ABD1B293_CARAN